MKNPKSDPRTVATDTGAKVNGQADHHNRTGDQRPARERFVQAHRWTVGQIESAIEAASCADLVRALDQSIGLTDTACDCPRCGSLRSVYAIGTYHWRCDDCHQLGSWLALRQSVAMSVECCVRLAEIVHGIRSEAA
jgi:hypothetical protein